MKANNGLFIVDDFGRQQVSPRSLLNRWIVPLERRVDFVTLHTGMKFEIPFDQLVIFATNIEPKELIDEAFLRRIRYKIKIDHPSERQYKQIFRNVCRTHQLDFNEEVFQHLVKEHYKKQNVKFNACHPRDLIEIILDYACFNGHPRNSPRKPWPRRGRVILLRGRREARGQRAEGRGQRAEGRGQRTEGRGQRAEDRKRRMARVALCFFLHGHY